MGASLSYLSAVSVGSGEKAAVFSRIIHKDSRRQTASGE